MIGQVYFSGAGDRPSPDRLSGMSGSDPLEQEDLPYRVELWDAGKKVVEQLLAVTANSSIGYAAYYAATRDHADRYITLRHKGAVLIRWNSPTN